MSAGAHGSKGPLVVISIVENRAREICVAEIDSKNVSTVDVHILLDNHSYSQVLSLVHTIKPHEILLADNCRNKTLSQRIIDEFVTSADNCRVLFISRQYFDQDRGAEMLKKVIVGEVGADMISKYIVLAGVYCLLRYIENTTGSIYSQNSLRLQHGSGGRERMLIDGKTSAALEIITNSCSGDQKKSLFGCMNYTRTVVGERLLKASLLRPSTDLVTIATRLDAVESLLRSSDAHTEVTNILSQFPDLDRMLGGLCSSPKTRTVNTARIGIDALIALKHSLRLLPDLVAAMEPIRRCAVGHADALLQTLTDNFSASSFTLLLSRIDDVLTESTAFSRSTEEMRHQECFAVRAGTHGLLDVARTSYLQCAEDIHRLAQEYSHRLAVPVKVAHGAHRGYYLQIPSEGAQCLPEEFLQAVLNKTSVSCTTQPVMSLSDRASESLLSALSITNEIIQALLVDVREHMQDLFSLADSAALLDMLSSFADLAALSALVYSRPEVTEAGPLVIDGGRHPVMSSLQPLHFVENSAFVNSLQNFQVVTGPNGSGKSTFIKQTAIIVIMAQMGCYVPARHAVVPIRDQIFSRIGTGDDMENNLSSFQVEMKETAHVLRSLSDQSLVIVDELGRGTSNADGVAIALAVGEYLLSTAAYTFFVTHYSQVAALAAMYANVKNVHFLTTVDVGSSALGYLHKIAEGPCDMKSGYGLLVAESCGLSEEFIAMARDFQRRLRRTYPLALRTREGVVSAAARMHRATALVQRLVILKDSTLDDGGIRSYLAGLSKTLTAEDRQLVGGYAQVAAGGAGPHFAVGWTDPQSDTLVGGLPPDHKAGATATDGSSTPHTPPPPPLCAPSPPISKETSASSPCTLAVPTGDERDESGNGKAAIALAKSTCEPLSSSSDSCSAMSGRTTGTVMREETTVINLFRSNRSKRKRSAAQ